MEEMTQVNLTIDDARILVWELTESMDELLEQLKLTGLEVTDYEKFT